MRCIRSSVPVVFVLSLLLLSSAGAQERFALVIGNGAYVHAPKLATAANDANALAATLGRIGFDVTVATDLETGRMHQALQQFAAKLGGAKVVLFYFTGLGLQIANAAHLAGIEIRPTDDADLTQYTVPLPAVLQQLAGDGRTLVVLFDASRSDPLPSRTAPRASAGTAPADPPGSMMIAFSTGPGAVVQESQGPNGPYATALIRHIGTQGAPIESVMRRVREDVVAATRGRQIPWVMSNLPDGFTLAPPR
jgi:uncharacterized caspase-like protein